MPDIAELLQQKTFVKTARSERADILKQIYPFYVLSTRKENWKRYIGWLKSNKTKNTKERVIQFKKEKSCLKSRNEKSFVIMLSHIPTKDLYYLLSIAKDKDKRGENFSGWLMGEIYRKDIGIATGIDER